MMELVGEGIECAVAEAMKMQNKPLFWDCPFNDGGGGWGPRVRRGGGHEGEDQNPSFETVPLMMVQVGEGHECAVVEAIKTEHSPETVSLKQNWWFQVGEGHECAVVEAIKTEHSPETVPLKDKIDGLRWARATSAPWWRPWKCITNPSFETVHLMLVQVGEGHKCAVVEAMKMQVKPLFWYSPFNVGAGGWGPWVRRDGGHEDADQNPLLRLSL